MKTSYVEKSFEVFLHTTIFLIFFEMASSFSFYLLEVSLAFLFVSFIFVLFKRYKFNIIKIFNSLVDKIKGSKLLVFLLGIYIIYDIIGLLYSPIFLLAKDKYKVVILMFFICLCVLIYVNNIKQLNYLTTNIGICGIFIAVITLLNYFLLRILPIHYTLRLSLRLDYNMYANTLLIGLICMFFSVTFNDKKENIKDIILLVALNITIPIIILSSSRRTFILMFPVLIVMGVIRFFQLRKPNYNDFKAIIRILIIAAITIGVTFLSIFLLQGAMKYTYEKYGSSIQGRGSSQNISETNAMDRYKTITNGNIFDKRKVIWKVAINEIKTFNTKEIIFGKGAGYDIHLYNISKDKTLNEMYDMQKVKDAMSAHNFLLADMLNGGIIKLILDIAIWVTVLWNMILMLYLYPQYSFLYSMIIGIGLINSLISNRFGFLYDKYIWLFLAMAVMEITFLKGTKRRING